MLIKKVLIILLCFSLIFVAACVKHEAPSNIPENETEENYDNINENGTEEDYNNIDENWIEENNNNIDENAIEENNNNINIDENEILDDFPESHENNDNIKLKKFLKAAWVPTVYNLNYPSKATANSTLLKNDIDAIIDISAQLGINALFFQVRPCADAFYKSAIFPWSKYLTGNQGRAPDKNFDPLAYFIAGCHKRDIELHAWINPLRITASVNDNIISSHPAAVRPELTFMAGGKLYFNPGVPDARQLIIDGLREIVINYDVDGIHFDDYFYPERDISDLDTFYEFGGRFNNIDDWRRNNIDELIRQAALNVKEINPDVSFGVSPSGIWANKSSNQFGSATNGFESYYKIYADSRGWVKKGYVDYICPQLYWYIGQKGSDYLTLLRWWYDVCKDTEVSLYIGLAGYKAMDKNQNAAWNNGEELEKQSAYALEYAQGIVIYAFNDTLKQDAIKAFDFLQECR